VDDLRQHGGRSGLGVKIWRRTQRVLPELHRHADRAVNDLGPVSASNGGGMPVLNTSTRTDYSGFGVDQILNVIDGIKSDPHSRRHAERLAGVGPGRHGVAPCHSVAVQFYVRDRELSCSMYQRSVDVALGLPSSTSPATPC
jgi:thymidylate synthase